jgi:hypothetical protein
MGCSRRRRFSKRRSPTCRDQCYQTFFVRDLRIFALSCSVCPKQAFPA